MRPTTITTPLLIALSLVSMKAMAHINGDLHSHDAFMQGLMHPLTGLDHLTAMVAVGLWSAQHTPRPSARALVAPLSFVACLLAGAVAGLAGLSLPAVEPLIAASLLVLGLLLAARQGLGLGASALLVGGFAVFHGLAHGAELAGGSAALALAGMTLSTLALHAGGLALGWASQRLHHALPRLAGLGLAGLGTTLLWQLA